MIDITKKSQGILFRGIFCLCYSDNKVTLQSEGNLEVKIIGIDNFGYLLVETPGGERISVQPDGNSFDMMKNLISMKTR